MTTRHLELVHADPPPPELVIVGCSAEKTATRIPLPALDLYDGGCVPPLRARIGHSPQHRSRVRFLSAEHGLITADTRLHPYDRPLDPDRAGELRPQVWAQLQPDLRHDGGPDDILILAEPLYLVLLADLLAIPGRPRLHWIPDHAHGWPDAAVLLDAWGW
ncbi:hypothetical protein OHA72_22145 [Dactylosporangium sp. NBC_01737]|uniref:DUF6884 domain-containing protein n=1 Tax=Dactylosporangium sp. NBC_01737 TaxID=2975959 RepID=UPI002E10DAB8|nr:DUF6884 domain-containing protein [Dactylosporangium sp. NBC_01737]WSG46020.1 hypothetical protein OHA72_22145 [Dactylosporangium sp. NBC_01737]